MRREKGSIFVNKAYVTAQTKRLIGREFFEELIPVERNEEALARAYGVSLTGLRSLAVIELNDGQIFSISSSLLPISVSGVRGGLVCVAIVGEELVPEFLYNIHRLKVPTVIIAGRENFPENLPWFFEVSEAAEEPILIVTSSESECSTFLNNLGDKGEILSMVGERKPVFNKHWHRNWRWNYLQALVNSSRNMLEKKGENEKVLDYYFSLMHWNIFGKKLEACEGFSIYLYKMGEMESLVGEKSLPISLYSLNPIPLSFLRKIFGEKGKRISLVDFDPPVLSDFIGKIFPKNTEVRILRKLRHKFLFPRDFYEIFLPRGDKKGKNWKMNGTFTLVSLGLLKIVIDSLQEGHVPIVVSHTSPTSLPSSNPSYYEPNFMVASTTFKVYWINELFDVIVPPPITLDVCEGLIDTGYNEGPVVLLADSAFIRDWGRLKRLKKKGCKVFVISENDKVPKQREAKYLDLDCHEYSKHFSLLKEGLVSNDGCILVLRPSETFRKYLRKRVAFIHEQECDSCYECVYLRCKAIYVGEDNRPRVVQEACTGCGACYIVCSRGAIEIKLDGH